MKKVTALWYGSCKELTQVRTMTISAMLLAMVIVLKVISIQNEVIRTGLSAIPSSMAFYILGPVGGGIFGAMSDLLYTLISGYTPNLGITLVSILTGVIFGAITYGKPVSLLRIVVARVFIAIICSMFLNTFFLAQMRGIPFWPLFVTRLWKNVIEVPITAGLYFALAKGLETHGVFRKLRGNQSF